MSDDDDFMHDSADDECVARPGIYALDTDEKLTGWQVRL
jgi:hypothetical protein